MESVFSKVTAWKLYTWIKVVSNMQDFLEILEKIHLFGMFQTALSTIYRINLNKTSSTSSSICYSFFSFSFLQLLTFPCTFVWSVTLTFKSCLTFGILEAYLEPSQKSKIELLVNIVNNFQWKIILAKELHLRCLNRFFI